MVDILDLADLKLLKAHKEYFLSVKRLRMIGVVNNPLSDREMNRVEKLLEY